MMSESAVEIGCAEVSQDFRRIEIIVVILQGVVDSGYL